MKENRSRHSPEILIELENAEKYYNSLPEVDWENLDSDLLRNKAEAYNKVHRLRRLYFDRH